MQVDADESAVGDITVLYNAAVLSFGNDMHGALFEAGEGAITHLNVRIYRDRPRSLTCLVSNERTAN